MNGEWSRDDWLGFYLLPDAQYVSDVRRIEGDQDATTLCVCARSIELGRLAKFEKSLFIQTIPTFHPAAATELSGSLQQDAGAALLSAALARLKKREPLKGFFFPLHHPNVIKRVRKKLPKSIGCSVNHKIWQRPVMIRAQEVLKRTYSNGVMSAAEMAIERGIALPVWCRKAKTACSPTHHPTPTPTQPPPPLLDEPHSH